MKKLNGSEIRKLWLDFFTSKGHEVIPSASLIPHDDPTLLWINAGIAPLKKYFDGREKPNNPRMTNAQKSIRTNDIDNVGKTARHHTFFEMLGNFSIGDYFREEVLTWAAELLFDEKWLGFDRDKIYITYYPDDYETFQKWQSVGVSADHLVPIIDNFWEIGEGPCGPDTEIFYDRGEKYDSEGLGIDLLRNDIENDRYIEIWNIVFSQYNSKPGLNRADYPKLPSKNIDTGCGLERLACVMQEVETNYDSDLFIPLIEYFANYTNTNYYQAKDKMPYRVIADHIRSVTFAISDGATFSNEGRGYVLRRILRRAVRYGKKFGINEPFLYKMVDIVVDKFKDFYGYLIQKAEIVKKIIKNEEENFLKTLESGEKRLLNLIKDSKVLSGKDAFLLYDTFGFPIELTIEICDEKQVGVDLDSFYTELNLQKERARKARSDQQSMNAQNVDYLSFVEPVIFEGYNTLKCSSKVIAIFKEGKKVDEASGVVDVITQKTPFYAEMGGQIGDVGTLTINDKHFDVITCYKMPNGQNAHVVELSDEIIKVGMTVQLEVNDEIHHNICCNHSATHLLNQALREVLGNHIIQHGSLVTATRLRFDFNHYQNPTIEEILKIEKRVNQEIAKNLNVVTTITSIEDAKKKGAQAVFGEKYGDSVRMVEMGFSTELCGGTHVKNIAEIHKFAIISIESKGSGIFRIEAVSGGGIEEGLKSALSLLDSEINDNNNKMLELVSKASDEQIMLEAELVQKPKLLFSYQDIIDYRLIASQSKKNLRTLEKKYEMEYRNRNSNDLDNYLAKIQTYNDFKYLIEITNDLESNILKDVVDKLADQIEKGIIFVANVVSGNPKKIIFIAKNKGVALSCGNLVKEAAIITGGNGGGRMDFAQAGGKDLAKLPEAMKAVEELIKK